MKTARKTVFDRFNGIIDKVVLFLYAFMLFFQTIRYYSDGDKDVFVFMYNVFFIALLAISIYKIIINLRTDFVISVLAAALIAFAIYCILAKNSWLWYMVFEWHCNVLNMAVLMVAMYGIRFSEIVGVFLITRVANVAIRIFAALLGFLPNSEWDALFLGKKYMVSTFGFGHKNVFFTFWFWALLAWLYLARKSRKKLVHAMLMTIFSLMFFAMTLSRTGIIVSSMALFMFYIVVYEESGRMKRWVKTLVRLSDKLFVIMPSCCALLSVVATIIFNYYTREKENLVVSNQLQRFSMFSLDCANHGIRLPFSTNNIEQVAPYSWVFGGTISTHYSDNIVHNVLIDKGIIWMIIFLTLIQVWAIREYRRKNRVALIIIFAISLYSVFESTASVWMHNVFMMLTFAKVDEYNATGVEEGCEGDGAIDMNRKVMLLVGFIILLVVVGVFLTNTPYVLWGLLAVDILIVGAYLRILWYSK